MQYLPVDIVIRESFRIPKNSGNPTSSSAEKSWLKEWENTRVWYSSSVHGGSRGHDATVNRITRESEVLICAFRRLIIVNSNVYTTVNSAIREIPCTCIYSTVHYALDCWDIFSRVHVPREFVLMVAVANPGQGSDHWRSLLHCYLTVL